MITKSIQQIAAQYERIWRLHFQHDLGTEKMWQNVDDICGRYLCKMAY